MKSVMFLIELPIRFIQALIGFTFGGWIGRLGIILVLFKIYRRHTLAVLASSVATRIRRHLLPVYDNRRCTVSGRPKKSRLAMRVPPHSGVGKKRKLSSSRRRAWTHISPKREPDFAPKSDAIIAEGRTLAERQAKAERIGGSSNQSLQPTASRVVLSTLFMIKIPFYPQTIRALARRG